MNTWDKLIEEKLTNKLLIELSENRIYDKNEYDIVFYESPLKLDDGLVFYCSALNNNNLLLDLVIPEKDYLNITENLDDWFGRNVKRIFRVSAELKFVSSFI